MIKFGFRPCHSEDDHSWSDWGEPYQDADGQWWCERMCVRAGCDCHERDPVTVVQVEGRRRARR